MQLDKEHEFSICGHPHAVHGPLDKQMAPEFIKLKDLCGVAIASSKI